MPGYNAPQPQSHAVSRVIAREEALERKRPAQSTAILPPLRFSYPGPLSNGVESPPDYPTLAIVVVQVRVSLLAAASADHVIEVRVDGGAIAQYTLPSGEQTVVVAAHIPVLPGSYVTVKTITVADTDLSVILRLQSR